MSSVQSEFEHQLQDPSVSFVRDYSADSELLLVAFGGINQGFGMTPFEFFKLTQGIQVKKLFFRDFHQSWYHRGLGGAGSSIAQAAKFIRGEMEIQGIKRTVLLGNSMGGYAALLFGCLAGAQEVHAFSPQTFISPWKLVWHRDFRYRRHIWRAFLSHEPLKHLDLAGTIAAATSTRCVIHYSTASRLDTAHARHLEGFQNVDLKPYPQGGHRLIRLLKQSGALAGFLEQILAPA